MYRITQSGAAFFLENAWGERLTRDLDGEELSVHVAALMNEVNRREEMLYLENTTPMWLLGIKPAMVMVVHPNEEAMTMALADAEDPGIPF